MQVYDLARAWEHFRAGQERDFLEEADGVWTYRRRFDASPQLVWEALTAPEFKLRWMDQVSAMRMENPQGRLGPGSVYHCAHSAGGVCLPRHRLAAVRIFLDPDQGPGAGRR